MRTPKLARLELQVLDVLWSLGNAPIREIQEAFPEPPPAYTTIQTTVYRLEAKGAVRRARKVSNAHIFEPIIKREVARQGLLDQILGFFGGRAQPMMTQLAEAGKLTMADVRALEKYRQAARGAAEETRAEATVTGNRRLGLKCA
ncbi:MAG TPA: BlaI/MecI/CopY family transcriptional regulator, partial [Vicinamibacterales bacterium]